jgi:hypothetical protein
VSLRRATGRWKRAVDRILPAGPTSAVLVEKTGRPCRAIRPFARVPAARNPRRAHDETRCAGRLGCALSNLAVGARCIARPRGKQCWRIAADARAKKVKGDANHEPWSSPQSRRCHRVVTHRMSWAYARRLRHGGLVTRRPRRRRRASPPSRGRPDRRWRGRGDAHPGDAWHPECPGEVTFTLPGNPVDSRPASIIAIAARVDWASSATARESVSRETVRRNAIVILVLRLPHRTRDR